MSKLIFIDTETGGFDERVHPLLEVAWAGGEGPVQSLVLPHDVRQCDEAALRVNSYDERRLWDRHRWADNSKIAALYAALSGATLVMSNPSFDERFLLRFQDKHPEATPYKRGPWLHRKIDISAYAMGILLHERPKGLHAICEELRRDWSMDVSLPDHGAANDVLALRSAFYALESLAGARR